MKPFIITVMILLTAGAAYFGWIIFQSAEAAALKSCASSIESALASKLGEPSLREQIALTNKWRELSNEEARILFDSLDSAKGYDCYRHEFVIRGRTSKGELLHMRAKLA